MRTRTGNPTRRLRIAIERLPRNTKEAMIRGIDTNRIIVGAYVDPRSGGICPMLAAHRSGGRTDVASFARAWDEYTGARRLRRATRREVRTLRTLLTESLDIDTTLEHTSIAELAAQLRAERQALRMNHPVESPLPPLAIPEEPGDTPITIRRRRVRGRAGAGGKDLLAAAEEQLFAAARDGS